MTHKLVTTIALLIFLLLAIAGLMLLNAYYANLPSQLSLQGTMILYNPISSLL